MGILFINQQEEGMKKAARGVSKTQVLQSLRYRGIYVERVMGQAGSMVWKASDGFTCKNLVELAVHFRVEAK